MVRLSTVLGFAFATASVLVPGVLSQDVPACALICAQSASDSSGCSLTDINCICTSETFATTAGQCVGSQCTSDERDAAQAYLLSICGATTSSSSPSSETSTGTDTSTSTDTDTSSVTPSSTTNTTPRTTSTSLTTTSPRTTTTSPSSTRTSSTGTTSSSSTPSNHATHDKPAGVLGAGLALGLALFAW